jgi:hypothetical protein
VGCIGFQIQEFTTIDNKSVGGCFDLDLTLYNKGELFIHVMVFWDLSPSLHGIERPRESTNRKGFPSHTWKWLTHWKSGNNKLFRHVLLVINQKYSFIPLHFQKKEKKSKKRSQQRMEDQKEGLLNAQQRLQEAKDMLSKVVSERREPDDTVILTKEVIQNLMTMAAHTAVVECNHLRQQVQDTLVQFASQLSLPGVVKLDKRPEDEMIQCLLQWDTNKQDHVQKVNSALRSWVTACFQKLPSLIDVTDPQRSSALFMASPYGNYTTVECDASSLALIRQYKHSEILFKEIITEPPPCQGVG